MNELTITDYGKSIFEKDPDAEIALLVRELANKTYELLHMVIIYGYNSLGFEDGFEEKVTFASRFEREILPDLKAMCGATKIGYINRRDVEKARKGESKYLEALSRTIVLKAGSFTEITAN